MDEDFDEYNEDDWDRDESPTIDCPECGELIYEDSQQCPSCLEYVSAARADRVSPWIQIVIWILVAVLVLPAILAALNLG